MYRHLDTIMKMIRYGASKIDLVPPEEGLVGTAMGGIIAAFSPPVEDSNLDALISVATKQDNPCRMMASETIALFEALLEPAAAADIEASENTIMSRYPVRSGTYQG